MKKARLSAMLLGTAITAGSLFAAPYKCDFEKTIDTSNHDFMVASNWGHIVGSYFDDDNYEDLYMTYNYKDGTGVNGSKCLQAKKQEGTPQYWGSGGTVKDYLVTPLVKGTVTMYTNMESGYQSSAYVEVYSINADGTAGELIKKLTPSDMGSASGTWVQVTLAEDLTDYQRLGLRCQYVSIDDFEATDADITPEPAMTFATWDPSGTTGVLAYWPEGPNHKVKITFTVTVTNTGDVELTPGMEGYSITVFNNSSKKDLFTVPVPETLGLNQTSSEFEVSGEVDPSDLLSWGTPIYLRENLTNTVIKLANSQYTAYEPVYVLRKAGSTTKSKLTDPIRFGMITETATTDLEFYNAGTAPLTIKSVTLPDGFTGAPEGEFVLDPEATKPFTITLSADIPGSYSGNLTVVYLDKSDNETTHELNVSGTVVDSNSWTCDFGTTKTDDFPAGSIVNTGVTADTQYRYGANNYVMKGSSYNADFITPLLMAEEGSTFAFDAACDGTSSDIKCYISTDRENWGDPVFEETVTSADLANKSFTFTEAGNFYVKLEFKKGVIDNLVGPAKADVQYDLYFKPLTSPESEQSGQPVEFNILAIAPIDLATADYIIEYVGNDQVLFTCESTDLTANAKNEIKFAVNFTPEVDITTVYDAFARVRFADGSTMESAHKDLTITNQPDFVFDVKGTGAKTNSTKPASRKTPITFGMTNETGVPQEYEIYNWGTAPLTVTSVTVPEGFTTDVTECTVAGKEWQPVNIAVSTEAAPGTYEGNLVIKYLDLNAEEQTYELPISATLLDPSIWYAPIVKDPEAGEYTNTIIWPAGTIHGKNISTSYEYNSAGNIMFIYASSYSSGDKMFISPKLHAEEGEVMSINTKLGNSTSGIINIYTAETREGLESEDTRTLVAAISGNSDDEALLAVKDSWKAINVEMPAGDYYVGFDLDNNIQVNYFYGLTPVAIGHDLVMSGFDIPAEAMQNVAKNMTISVRNFGLAPETSETYTVAAFVDGEKATETEGSTVIPVNTSYSDAATLVPVTVRYPKVGTFPVYLQLTAGEQVLTTETVEVTFAEETFSADKQIGEVSNTQAYAPLDLYNKNSECMMLYNAGLLGLNDGDKVSDMSFKGFSTKGSDINLKLKIYYQWTNEQTITKPESGIFDPEAAGMTPVTVDTEARIWGGSQGTSNSHVDLISLHFDEPIIYENGKSLLLYVSHWDANGYIGRSSYGYETSATTGACYYHSNDNSSSLTSWSTKELPVLYMSLVAEPTAVSGKVTDNGEAVEGAVVTLVSNDGDNVQYTGTTAADGTYSINIIQNSRAYDVTASTDGKEDFVLNQIYTENTTRDFALLDVVEIDNTVGGHAAKGMAVVKLNLNLEAGYNTLVLPFNMTATEAAELFGEDSEVLYFGKSELGEAGDLRMYFGHEDETAGIKAGKPYVINMYETPVPVRYRGKAVIAETSPVSDENVAFQGTYEFKALEEGMFLLNSGNFVPAAANARSASDIAPYSAYVKAVNSAVKSVTFTVDDNVASAIEEIDAELFNENDVIYNLQGVRVYNPEKGIYIVNGKKVMVK